jgi:hypothetical protein
MFPPLQRFYATPFQKKPNRYSIIPIYLLCGFFRGQYREKKGGVSSGEKQAGVGVQASGSAAGHGVELQKVEPDPGIPF